MEIIRQEHPWFLDHLVRQPLSIINHRLSDFVIKHTIDDGYMLYNVATGCIVFLKNNEDLSVSFPSLVEKWFYVPEENFSEYDWIDFLRKKKLENAKDKGINAYVILTTLDCNARCFYCYEKGAFRISMSKDTANALADYIIKNSQGKVKLSWFGGEPLMNTQVIDLICNKLKGSKEFYSHMTTNGLLFSESLIKKAVSDWNLEQVQITLDGTETIYRKAKAYVKANGNEFKTVLHNIGLLLNSHIAVSIRLNQDVYNTEDLLKLCDQLDDEFKGNKYLTIYNHLLFNFTGDNTEEQVQCHKRLKSKLIDLGYLKGGILYHGMIASRCMADNNESAVVTPLGKIGKCEHFYDKYFVGTIFDTGLDETMMTKWKERYNRQKKCNPCPLYPTCIRLTMCPTQKESCPDYQRSDMLSSIHIALSNYYHKWRESTKKRD